MARPPRFSYPKALHHVTMRCNNKEFLFDEHSQELFLHVLRESCEMYPATLFNYCLMTNHVHLLFQARKADTLSRFMQRLAGVFANRFNRSRDRKGHLWEGRFLSTVVEPGSYFLRCMAYIDLNPVRAGMVSDPAEYPWCAHRFILEEDESFVTLHRAYWELGPSRSARRGRYLEMLDREAGREPHSLAGVLFVGRRCFTERMRKRFELPVTPTGRFRDVPLEDDVIAVQRG